MLFGLKLHGLNCDKMKRIFEFFLPIPIFPITIQADRVTYLLFIDSYYNQLEIVSYNLLIQFHKTMKIKKCAVRNKSFKFMKTLFVKRFVLLSYVKREDKNEYTK
jgi:hypothetical protein